MKVLVLLSVIGHARDSKRIDMLLSEGAAVEVAAFNRSQHLNRAPRCPVTLLADIRHGQYLRRIFVMFRCLPKVIRLAKRSDIIYASGQDMGLFGVFATLFARIPIVLEVGDIREIQLDYGVRGKVVRAIDRWMTDRIAFLTVTAEGFATGYYKGWLAKEPDFLTIENKLEEKFVSAVDANPPAPRSVPANCEPIVIGYFGLLRYQWCIDALAQVVANAHGGIEVLLAGDPSPGVDISPLTNLRNYVEFLGPYKSPADLKSMYERIDLVWCCNPISCLDSEGNNWPWARTNRFYESCLFRKPMIVLDGIGDADAVRRAGIGTVLRSTSMADVRACIEQITPEAISSWRTSFEALPRSVFMYSDEARKLVDKMRRAVMQNSHRAID